MVIIRKVIRAKEISKIGEITMDYNYQLAQRMLALVQSGESCSTCSNKYGDCPYEDSPVRNHWDERPNVNGIRICHKHSKM